MAADLILTNGVVHTVDAARSVREAVAVADGRILAVGSAAEIAELAGPGTRIVDVEGGMVLPGFQDAHCHLALSGYEQTLCDLFESRSAEEHLRRIAEYARAHPDRDWVLGGGWSMSDFPGGIPTREQLDAVVADRPAVLTNRDGHGSWANTRALELAGIGRDTPDPAGGRIERDEHGEPVGMLQEQAMWLVLSLAPEPDADQRAAGVLGSAGVLPPPGHNRLPGRGGEARLPGGLRAAGAVRRADPAGSRQPGLGADPATTRSWTS